MTLASLVLVTSALAAASPAASPVAAAQGSRGPTPVATATQQGPDHQLGFGASIGASNVGAGGSVRYWFSDRVGAEAVVGYSRGINTGVGHGPSSVNVNPSVIYTLRPSNNSGDVTVRPFIGGGLTYGRYSGYQYSSGPSSLNGQNTLGGQAFGGAEIGFSDMKQTTISAQVVYYRYESYVATAPAITGVTGAVAIHFYLK
jgi:hypothetical protein